MAPAQDPQKSGNSAAVPTEVSPRVGSPSSGRWDDLRSSGAGAVGDPVAALLARAHHARMEVRRIQAEMRACQCQHELAADICSERAEENNGDPFSIGEPLFRDPEGREYNFRAEDFRPCWKGEYIDYGELGGYYKAAGDYRPGGWCDPCEKRETIRKGLEPARRRLAGLKSAIWRAAKRCAEEVVSLRPCPGCLGCCAPIPLHPQLLADARKVGIEACDGSGVLPAKRFAGGGR